MEQNRLIRNESGLMWHQIVRSKGEAKLKERIVPLLADVHKAVDDFAEFCIDSGGNRYASVVIAMNEINAQSKELLDKVSLAEREDEVEAYGSLLNTAISLFKALEAYYVHLCGPRTGTTGD